MAPTIGDDPPRSAAWGYCDRDYSRVPIASPYSFTTAQAHYEALLEETRDAADLRNIRMRRSPPTGAVSTRPRGRLIEHWYALMLSNQVSTILSLLTPEYQARVVQDLYHQGVTNAPQWPSTYCWPEGFIRRWYFAAVNPGINPHQVLVTPELVQILTGVARNFVTQVHVGRTFNMEGAVPRLGADVPRWYGETIGFWDGDALITGRRTSNRGRPTARSSSPTRCKRSRSTRRNATRRARSSASITKRCSPTRRRWSSRSASFAISRKPAGSATGTPYAYVECIQTIYSVNGISTPVAPNTLIQYQVPDMFGQPWAQTWQQYHEQGMTRPESEEDLFNFD